MKPQTCLAVVLASLLLFVPTLGMAEEQKVREAENELSVDLALPVTLNLLAPHGTVIPIYLDYQRVLADHLVLSIAPSVLYVTYWNGSLLLTTLWVELDWHPFQNGLTGFFVGPAAVTFVENDYYTSDPSVFTFGAMLGLSVGYQFLLPANFDIDIVVGLALGFVEGEGVAQALPRAALALGYRF